MAEEAGQLDSAVAGIGEWHGPMVCALQLHHTMCSLPAWMEWMPVLGLDHRLLGCLMQQGHALDEWSAELLMEVHTGRTES